jgi:hypothetical protein
MLKHMKPYLKALLLLNSCACMSCFLAPGQASIQCAFTNAPVAFPVAFSGSSGEGDIFSTNRWDFGDGTVVSNQMLTLHAWATSGQYAVIFSAYSPAHSSWLNATQSLQVTPRSPVTLLASQSGSGQVTFSWPGRGTLLGSTSLDPPAWVRLSDTSPVTLLLPHQHQNVFRYFKVMSLPADSELEAAYWADFNNCVTGKGVLICEECVTSYLLSQPLLPIGLGLAPSPVAEEAAALAYALGSALALDQLSALSFLRFLWFGP